jgi:hypothetical protein
MLSVAGWLAVMASGGRVIIQPRAQRLGSQWPPVTKAAARSCLDVTAMSSGGQVSLFNRGPRLPAGTFGLHSRARAALRIAVRA